MKIFENIYSWLVGMFEPGMKRGLGDLRSLMMSIKTLVCRDVSPSGLVDGYQLLRVICLLLLQEKTHYPNMESAICSEILITIYLI
jgi:hypothetical protein